ncbi:MAG: SGNH/GDSL hydrolase family protein [Alphaproteobacteria bacterium]|nr:SGNH/GDSL hydrolase family protein [Alphaproteobacteria bacterium]
MTTTDWFLIRGNASQERAVRARLDSNLVQFQIFCEGDWRGDAAEGSQTTDWIFLYGSPGVQKAVVIRLNAGVIELQQWLDGRFVGEADAGSATSDPVFIKGSATRPGDVAISFYLSNGRPKVRLYVQGAEQGQYPDRRAKTLGQIGDSRIYLAYYSTATANKYENVGAFEQANYKMKQRFYTDQTLNKGVSGDTLAEMVARITDIDDLAADGADLILLRGQTNDHAAGRTANAIQADYTTLINRIVTTNGKVAVVMKDSPREDGANNSVRLQVNTWLDQQASDNVLIVGLDSSYNATTGSDTSDGVHDNPRGANKRSDDLVAALRPYFGDGESITDLTGTGVNEDMSGTGGTLGVGVGSLADSWASVAVGTITNSWITFSKTVEGYQKIVVNIPQGNGSAVGFYINQIMSGFSSAKNYIADAEIDIQALSDNVEACQLEVREEGSGSNIYHTGLDVYDDNTYYPRGEGISKTPIIDTNVASTRHRVRFYFEGDSTGAAVTATIILKSIRIREV